jgi:RHS repeat-associated protein
MFRTQFLTLAALFFCSYGGALAQDYSPAPVDTDPETFTPREPTTTTPAGKPQPEEQVSANNTWLLGPMTSNATAQEEPVVEWDKRQSVEERLRQYGPDLLGDQIDPHTGAISFQHTDVSLPGNSALEVAVQRRRAQGMIYHESVDVEFGDWELVVPRIHVLSANFWTGNRCSNSYATSFPSATAGPGNSFQNSEYSEGVVMDVPGTGAGAMQVLESKQGAQWPTAATHVTTEGWYLTCGTASDGGQGFVAHAPNGNIYKFDTYISVLAKSLGVWGSSTLGRRREILAASEVTDVNGNWVRYVYDTSGRLTKIHSNDGRVIDLSYSGTSKLISQVTANGRTWQYTYGASTYSEPIEIGYYGTSYAVDVLRTVTQPDGRQWSFQIDGMTARSGPGTQCAQLSRQLTVTHPYGATGTFSLAERVHRQSYNALAQITYSCPNDPDIIFEGTPPPIFGVTTFETMSVTQKTLSGPNVPLATWTYTYEQDPGAPGSSGGDRTNWTQVQDPAGTFITYFHYWNAEPDGGKLAERQVRDGNGAGPILHTEIHEYDREGVVGATFIYTGPMPQTTTRPSRQIQSTIWRKGDMFRTHNTYNVNHASADYSHGFPVTVGAWGSTSGGYAARRTTDTDYEHNTTKWVLGLPTKVTRNSKIFDEHSYDSLGRRLWTDRFGARNRTYTYHTTGVQAGLVKTVKDGLNRITTLANYKRGEPQTVTRPDGVNLYSTVEDNGWLANQTDAKGVTTYYQYNNMGWLTLIDRPSPWEDTNIYYGSVGANTYQRTTRGTQRTVIWYDELFRPWKVRNQALSGGGLTTYVRTEYDTIGRPTFVSFPSLLTTPVDGTNTTYDGLGRPTQIQENVAPTATTMLQYLSLARTRTTDPEGNVTTVTSQGYGSPDDGGVMKIDQPTDVTTDITRDIYGNMTSVRQYGAHNGFSVDQTQDYYYDARLRLCRHSVPETGDTLFAYNTANELTGVARGQSSGVTCGGLPADSVFRTYDTLGRVTLVNYPGATKDIVLGYDANGNVTSNIRGGVNWSYAYDTLNNLTRETLAIDSRSYETTYSYRDDQALKSQTTPGVRTVWYTPNGLGQARTTSAGGVNYASNAAYHANGGLISLDYGNGQVLTQGFNARQLLSSIKVEKPGVFTPFHFTYAHDANGRITTWNNLTVAGQDRSFTYDGLGRLATATGPWGATGASFTYDSLGNLRKKKLGSRVVDIQYLADNRINRARDTADGSIWRDYAHDARGNVTGNDRLTFTYDAAEQPTAISGAASGTFTYDGNLKRVKQVLGGETVYSVYGLSGAVLYRDNVTTGVATDYLRLGGKTIARLKTVSGSTTVSYLHQDHLGSPAAATDGTGAKLWRENYTPYGEERVDDPANDNDESFTGHIKDDATGLTYMQARYFDPVIGRFLSGDPVGFSEGQPQMFNRYTYVTNDPINQTDATGQCPWCIGAIVGAIAGAVIEKVTNPNATRESIAVATLVGAASGALGPAGGAAARAALVGRAGAKAAAVAVKSGTATQGVKALVVTTDIAADVIGQPALGAAVAAVSGDDPARAAIASEGAAAFGAVERVSSSDKPRGTTRVGLARTAVSVVRQVGATIVKGQAGEAAAEQIVEEED